ncbi:MAG: hypothetical protein Q8L92_16965, partial [Rubrivivax sp.]|nr:hypothetical protein [Rubrivivax sp.]
MAANAGLAITLAASNSAQTKRRMMRNSEKGLHPMGKQAIGQPNVDPGWRWVSERGLRVATGATTLERYLSLVSQ